PRLTAPAVGCSISSATTMRASSRSAGSGTGANCRARASRTSPERTTPTAACRRRCIRCACQTICLSQTTTFDRR
ncbi:hypothetical protein OC835_007840, partial [Tilletia horrida]